MKRVLIAGIGNIFLGDDAFGVEVVRQLADRSFPDGVQVEDFGIRSYDLAYALVDQYDAVILVDAAPRGREPGSVYLLEPDLSQLDQLAAASVDAHTMNPLSVLQMARHISEITCRVLLIGCEPAAVEESAGMLALSPPVQAAIPRAIRFIEILIAEFYPETKTNASLAPA